MESVEQEDSSTDVKEKIPVSGKKHGILPWKLPKDQTRTKKDANESDDISLVKFEQEAKKMCQKYSEYTQRKEQETSKVSSVEASQGSVWRPINVRRINVMPCDPGNYELTWNDIGMDSDNDNTARPAVASLNYDSDYKISRSAVATMRYKNNPRLERPAVSSTKCGDDHDIARPAVALTNSDNDLLQPAVVSMSCNNGPSLPQAEVKIKCDDELNIPKPAVVSLKCDDEREISRPAVAPIKCDDERDIPRPAVASLNLINTKTSSKTDKNRRLRRSRELKRSRPIRFTRAKNNKRYEEYFLEDSESETDDEEVFNLKKELAVASANHFNRWQKQKVENEKISENENEKPKSDLDKWVFDVLSISKVINPQTICEPRMTTLPPLPPEPETKISEDDLNLRVPTPELEAALVEYSEAGPDSESKPYTGSPEQIPVSNVIETLPNMVPRDGQEDDPIKHWHHISNEPISDDEEEPEYEGIMGMTTWLFDKAIRPNNKKTEVKPFRQGKSLIEDLKDDYSRDEAPDRWSENLINDYDHILATMRLN